MSGSVSRRSATGVSRFEPKDAKLSLAKADLKIDYAKRLKDVALLDTAIDEKLGLQEDVVAWWRANVTPNKGGDRRSDQSRRTPTLTSAEAEQLYEITKQQVSKWATRLKRRDEYRAALRESFIKALMAEGGSGVLETLNTGDMEGYTPAKYIEAARRAMGGIDTDPATTAMAQEIVQAKNYYTKADDGLAQEWRGRVWLNPPYNSGLIEKFIGKLLSELACGNANHAILLTNNNTDTGWFHKSAAASNVICLTKGRINFYKPDSSVVAPTNGQAFFYFGPDVASFARQFSDIGLILTRYV